MPSELDIYKSNLDQTIPDLRALKEITTKIGYLVTTAKVALNIYKKANKIVDDTGKGVAAADAALTVLGLVSPLKAPVKGLQLALKKIKKPIDKIDEKFDEINGKDDTSTPQQEAPGEALQKVEANLATTALVIAGVQDSLTLKLRQIEIASEAIGNFKGALAVATSSGETWSGKYTALDAAVEAQLAARNDLIPNVAAFFTGVKGDVDAFLKLLQDIDFESILGELVDLEEIGKLFDFLEKPLEIAGSLIEPIKPLLNAIDALIGLIINPVIDFVLETLSLDTVLDGATDAINALIPSIGLLEAFENLFQPFQDFLLEYITDALGTLEYLDLVESAFFGGVAGQGDKGPTSWGNDVANVLTGDDGDDILDALGDRDIILGKGGNDIIIAGAGSDFIDGGTGDDLIYFNASFTEYELLRDPATGNIIVSHLAPSDPDINTGIDVLAALDDGDSVVFTDISFTGLELNNALIGGSVLNGDNSDNLMFLNSTGTPVGGFHVANGRGGGDRIFGSTLNDILNGGKGNDVLLPGLGDDQVNGQGGTDTFQVLEGADSKMTVDLVNGTSIGQGSDTLSSIENVVVSADRNHKVRGSNADNVIHTGDAVDVISGLGGNDTIDAGGGNDFIIGGRGSDIIRAGAGNVDVMISGSKAKAGVTDLYLGGDGYDVVSYTSNSNTIKFDINDESSDPGILQTLKSYMTGIPDSGPVKIKAATGKIIRYDLSGTKISTDRAISVEGFMGSDRADVLIGAVTATLLHGAGGKDLIRTGGTENINGGEGDDLIYAENVDGGSTALQIDGGDGFDRLKLEDVGQARWFYQVENASSLKLRAHETTVLVEDLRNEGDVFFSIKPRNIEEITLGNFADHAIYNPGGTQSAFFYLLDGNDRFDGLNGFADVAAGAGNDRGNFTSGGGIFRGMTGDDYAIFNDSGSSNAALMGDGSDFVQIERFFGVANGGKGYDTISFDITLNSRIVANLATGTVVSFKGISTAFSDRVGMTLSGFEALIATNFNDVIDGSDRDEQIIGRDGIDIIRGAGGRDKLFGGTGNDTLDGGAREDLLHGGLGNDTLDGGTGSDTASYAWARPGGLDGALFADSFTGVNIDLNAGTATGAFGNDTLISIENVIGSGGNDILQGNRRNNLLSGGDGDDDLQGKGGDDVLVTGSGTDVVSGGDGKDRVVVGLGNKTLSGGTGFDTLDFGTVRGAVSVDFSAGTYAATFVDQSPRWSDLDPDGDGIDESDGTEARLFNGVMLTPTQVFEANPQHANSIDDITRILPTSDDAEFDLFQIVMVDVDANASGTFVGFEKVVGGESGTTIILSNLVDRFDGRVSDLDVIDLSGVSSAMSYDLTTGVNDIALLAGDNITGIEGLIGGAKKDRFTGDGNANMFSGGAGNDVLEGLGGRDTLLGGLGRDILRGGDGKDSLIGGGDDDTLYGGDKDDDLHGGAGADTLFGGNGNDTLSGGIFADTLRGGKGDDRLVGGNGTDSFVFASGDGRDVIVDFKLNTDTITLNGVTAADITITTRAQSTKIDYGPGDSIILKGFTDTIDVIDLL